MDYDDKYILTINTEVSLQGIANIFGVSIKDVLEGKLGVLVLEEGRGAVTVVDKQGVHTSHCCKWHGCKYGDEDCPVVIGIAEQEYLCEYYYQDLENEEYHRQILKDIEEIKKFNKNK